MGKVLTLISFLLANAGAHGAQPHLFIDDPERLAKLEEAGLDFARWVMGRPERAVANSELIKSPRYLSFKSDLEAELVTIKKGDPLLSVTMSGGHRLFNGAWLTSPLARFELVGIAHRLDRRPFHDVACGEVRFIYRLAYSVSKPKPIYSRLPMTVNAVFFLKGDADCQGAARAWSDFLKASEAPDNFPRALHIAEMKSIEVNLQTVRWPSTIRPDMGGHAEYLLKVYALDATGLSPSTLENTPNVEDILSSPAKKKRLLAWIRDPKNLSAIDQGIPLVPEEFLATRATSVALAGNHRLANAPYTRIFRESDFAGLDFSSQGTVKSAHGLLRRLNDLTCMGCHQGRTVAGFHFLGRDRAATDTVNAIHVSASSHFLSDRARREAYFGAVMAKQTPKPFRDFSVRAPQDQGSMGSHCGLGDPTFARWTCAPGLRCKADVRDKEVSRTGVCMPKNPLAGSSCRSGEIKASGHPHKDRIKLDSHSECGGPSVCEDVSVGFPSGMCSGGCEDLKEGEICGSIALLHGFNSCLAANKLAFSECLSNNVRPGALAACSESRLCRDDYICARVAGGGGCIPPYFLFQLRVDGHPRP